MHEMSIVEALLEELDAQRRPYPGARVITVRLRIGALRAVVPELLQFCFAAATRGTACEGARLEVEPVAATACCQRCRRVFTVEDDGLECPRCHAPGAALQTGRELELIGLELEPLVPAGPA